MAPLTSQESQIINNNIRFVICSIHQRFTMSTLSNDVFVEMREISKDKRYENKYLYQMYHGQLQLSVVRDGRFVCVNVQSARHMKPTTTNLYVKIKLTHSYKQRNIHRHHQSMVMIHHLMI